jgi:hypothetical protein
MEELRLGPIDPEHAALSLPAPGLVELVIAPPGSPAVRLVFLAGDAAEVARRIAAEAGRSERWHDATDY